MPWRPVGDELNEHLCRGLDESLRETEVNDEVCDYWE